MFNFQPQAGKLMLQMKATKYGKKGDVVVYRLFNYQPVWFSLIQDENKN